MSTRSMRFLLITNLKNAKNCLGDGWEIILHSVRMTVVYVCGGVYVCFEIGVSLCNPSLPQIQDSPGSTSRVITDRNHTWSQKS